MVDRQKLGSRLLFSTLMGAVGMTFYIVIQAFRGHIFLELNELPLLGGLTGGLVGLSIIGSRLNPTPTFVKRRDIRLVSHLTTVALFQLLTLVLLIVFFLNLFHRVPEMTLSNLFVATMAGLLTVKYEDRLRKGPIDWKYFGSLLLTNFVMVMTLFTVP